MTVSVEQYVRRIEATEDFLGLTRTCPECGAHVYPGDPNHVLTSDGYVVVGCEGYWTVNPNLVGVYAPNWCDWRETQ